MPDECLIFLEKESYCPGEVINGKVECHFSSENKVRDIRVRFRSRAQVVWSEGRSNKYKAEDVYFEMQSNLLTVETTFQAGFYVYPFTFQLPFVLPSSMSALYGNITYTVRCTIDRPWAVDFEAKKSFIVNSYNDLNKMTLKTPVEIEGYNDPYFFFMEKGDPIVMTVRLPVTGYVPSQMINFTANVKNAANFAVRGIRFNIVQGFTFPAYHTTKTEEIFVGQEFEIVDSTVPPKSERKWDNLQLRVPAGIFNASLDPCKLIKVFWELRGQVILPFGHKNIMVRVPIVLGAEPLDGIAM